MRLSNVGPRTIVKWARRSLYVLLFISFIVVYGKWHAPITYTFLGAILSLILPLLFSRLDEEPNPYEEIFEGWDDESSTVVE